MRAIAEHIELGRLGWFFVVLPDCDEAIRVADLVRPMATQRYLHASGRLWLAGRWDDSQFTLVSHDGLQTALFGPGQVLTSADQFDALARRLSAGQHVVASGDGRVRVRGSASGLSRVYSSTVDGITIAASRSDVLAALTNAGLDEVQIATRLLSSMVHPLEETPVWRGVRAIRPGSTLELDRDGAATTEVWWTALPPDTPLSDGRERVREALQEAVSRRTAAGGLVTCDLSGGMDSTAISFLAALGPAKVLARTMPGPDSASDDLVWARRAAAHLPQVEHLIWDEEWPLRYSGISEFDDILDEPSTAIMSKPELARFFFPLTEYGGRMHLTGIGGDHVTWCSPAHYHDLLIRQPLLAMRRIRGFRALHHWPMGATVRALANRKPYPAWLADAADGLHKPLPELEWTLGWGSPPRLPEWTTPAARDSVRRLMKQAAATVAPLSHRRGEHVELQAIRHGTGWLRHVEQICDRAGLALQSPFFDDQVVEACLAVRPQDRVTPWQYRPVLKAAMENVMPRECLQRATKGTFSGAAARSLTDNRADLLALTENSRLAALGIVDAAQLRASISSTMSMEQQNLLMNTVAAEVWLRTLAQ